MVVSVVVEGSAAVVVADEVEELPVVWGTVGSVAGAVGVTWEMVFSTVFPQAQRIAPAAVIAAARSKRFI